MDRRSLLKWATGALSGLVGAAVAGPIVTFVGHPLGRSQRRSAALPVADLTSLPEGVPVKTAVILPLFRDAWSRFEKVPLGAVWLLRRGEQVQALSATCPHAGCFIDFEPKAGHFACPCHGSAFDLDGHPTAGPSPRPMDGLAAEVREGKVLVAFARFRQGLPNKEEI